MTVLIADDHPIYIEGLSNLLKSYDFTVVGCAMDGKEAVKQAILLQPDVILMDANMPEMNGIEATKKIKESLPEIKIIILTGIEDDTLLFDSIQAGASGFLLKKLNGGELNQSLRDLQAGKNPFSQGVEDSLLKEFRRVHPQPSVVLMGRQIEILKRLSMGLTPGTAANAVSAPPGEYARKGETQRN